MTFLWLKGRRVDSVPLLRAYLRSLDGAELREACSALLKKYREGVLTKWFARQKESRKPDSALEAKGQGKENQNAKLYLLADRSPEDLDGALPLLARLCDVEEDFLRELAEIALPQMGSVDPHVLQRVQQQSWYQEDEQVRQLLANVNLEFVVDGPEALARLAQRYCDGGNSRQQTTVYLCNTGKPVVALADPTRYRGLRLVGCGDPIVRFGAQCRGKTLDLQTQDLIFENLTLNPHGMRLAVGERILNRETQQEAGERLKNVTVRW